MRFYVYFHDTLYTLIIKINKTKMISLIKLLVTNSDTYVNLWPDVFRQTTFKDRGKYMK